MIFDLLFTTVREKKATNINPKKLSAARKRPFLTKTIGVLVKKTTVRFLLEL